jgi:hypothetical protein
MSTIFSHNQPQSDRNTLSESSFPEELEHSARELAERLVALPLPGAGLTLDYLFEYADQHGITDLIVLDQKVHEIETEGIQFPFGYQVQRLQITITVIDHHVSDPTLSALSTGNLVLKYFQHFPQGPSSGATIAITHGDCDSVLSACMMLGAVPCKAEFGEAVLAADHSFEANPIADLLQAIEGFPVVGGTMPLTKEDAAEITAPSIERSLRNLGLLLQGKDLDSDVALALAGRLRARSEWVQRLEAGKLTSLTHGTVLCVIDGKPSQDPYPEFLKAIVPEASAFLIFHQVPEKDDFLQVRALAGSAFPAGASFGDASLISKDLVPGFGGRRDAGSNRRGGISFSGDPLATAQAVDARIGAIRAQSRSCNTEPAADAKG